MLGGDTSNEIIFQKKYKFLALLLYILPFCQTRQIKRENAGNHLNKFTGESKGKCLQATRSVARIKMNVEVGTERNKEITNVTNTIREKPCG